MYKKSFFAVLTLLIALLMIVSMFPVGAWDYTDETTPNDLKYEKFGPRADRLLIKLYEDAEAEWDALDAGELDVTDWPLTKPYYDKFTTPPEDNYTETMYYGAEFAIRLLDINNNPEPYLGNPPNPAYPNPVYPNPTSQINMRKAIWYLHDKATWLPTVIGVGFYADLYTVVPPCFGAFHLPMANPYPYSPAAAIAELETDEDGNGAPDFPWEDANDDTLRDEGEVFWDIDGNGENDGGDENLCIIFVVRSDDIHRFSVANKLIAEMRAIGISVDARYGPVALAYTLWFYGKAAHLYTGAWGLWVNPNFIYNWHWFWYWHPGFCCNTGAVHDPILDDTSRAVMTANTEADALTNCLAFQDRFAVVAAAVPWWSYSGTMAVSRTYTGGTGGTPTGDPEDPYRGNYWDGIVNVPGYGPSFFAANSFFSFLNMHPRGYEAGEGNMTIRCGFKTAELNSFNPVYAEWAWEWAILDEIYDTLLKRNPYTLEPTTWMASNYAVENYEHPVFGTCTKVVFTLRPDVFFSDGSPLTVADIMFTFVELDDILLDRGLPPPWWYEYVAMILSFSILDAYNFEVLFDTKGIYHLMCPGGTVVLPKHIWKPLAETGPVDSMTAEPDMIGPGPWRFKEHVAYSHVLMVANKPDSTVTTSHEGSTPITSTYGYFKYDPIEAPIYTADPPEYSYRNKLPDIDGNYTINFDLTNLYENNPVDMNVTIEVYNNTTGQMDVIGDENITDTLMNSTTLNAIETQMPWGCRAKIFVYRHRIRRLLWWWLYRYTIEFKVRAFRPVIVWVHLKWPWFLHCWRIPTMTLKWQWITIWRFSFLWIHERKMGPRCRRVLIRDDNWWFTIKEDIAGSTFYDDMNMTGYPYKKQLPTPDFKVDIKDVAKAAKAFGSYPGHPRWDTVSDIFPDYKIDIKDIAGIAKKYGWIKT